MAYPQCLEPFKWDRHMDKSPNDYRTKDDKVNYYGEPMSKEAEAEYLDLLLSREEQGLPNYY